MQKFNIMPIGLKSNLKLNWKTNLGMCGLKNKETILWKLETINMLLIFKIEGGG